jgi:hypothetical protein
MLNSFVIQAVLFIVPGIIRSGQDNRNRRMVLRFRFRFITPRKTGHAVVKNSSEKANNDEL